MDLEGWGELTPSLIPQSHSRGACKKKTPILYLINLSTTPILANLANMNSKFVNFITYGKYKISTFFLGGQARGSVHP